MKRYFIVIMLLVGSLASYSQLTGGGRETRRTEAQPTPQKEGYTILKSGFFVDIMPGFGFETVYGNYYYDDYYDDYYYDYYYDGKFTMAGFSARIGTKWYFGKNQRFRAGFQMTWVRIGFFAKSSYDAYAFQIAPVNLGFTGIIAFNSNMGIEINYIMGMSIVASTFADGAIGFMQNPNVKFRFNRFSVGIDLTYGPYGIPNGGFDDYYRHNTFSFILGAKF